MCTAITFSRNDFYFGRTLDLDRNYGQDVVICPRNFPLPFRQYPTMDHHHAIIGMAHVSNGYPLFFDASNEFGLCMAGLNFPGFAQYDTGSGERFKVASFEFIPWILGQCGSIQEVRNLLPGLRLTGIAFSPELPPTPLHWIIADRSQCICIEAMASGIHVHENPVGVLTNTPPFDDQMFQLQNFMHLSAYPPHNHFSPEVDLTPYSQGMGALGLPGDLSSQSRFVRAAFTKLNSLCREEACISQFFHILDSVGQTQGCCRLTDGSCEITQYTSCCNASCGTYYYTTYGNRRIRAVELHREDLESSRLHQYPLVLEEDILFLNRKQS